jgi:hypothetical protein
MARPAGAALVRTVLAARDGVRNEGFPSPHASLPLSGRGVPAALRTLIPARACGAAPVLYEGFTP